MHNSIESQRLLLIPMTRGFLEASLTGNMEAASHHLEATLPPEWLKERWLMKLRLQQLCAKPDLEPWLLRAIVLRRDYRMVGHIGFHDAPGAESLHEYAPGGVELGYTVYSSFQRQGYATEARETLMNWAQREHHVVRFVVSISPQNTPSLLIAHHFGFRHVGSQWDERDGEELIFVRDLNDAT